MAWLKTLAETYDVNADLVGKEKNGKWVLLPICHSTFNAQIEVRIGLDGNFKDARKLEKGGDIVTVIPVTEDSAARSSGIAPHPLCDKLCYIAGDYTAYTGDDKEAYYEAYLDQLKDWAESEDSHPMVKAVYAYLKKSSLIQDLTERGVLRLDENGRLTDGAKIQAQGQTGANVRFIVSDSNLPFPHEVWKNQGVYQAFIRHYQKNMEGGQLCYATGKTEICSDKHPSKIRNSSDKSKLISGNDESGFTYRGRFAEKGQAVSVGYETSQKAHNALRWLIQKQGYTRDDSAIVTWIVNRDMPAPDMMKDSVNAFCGMEGFEFDFDTLGMETETGSRKPDTGKVFAERFNRAVNGYAAKIRADDKAAIIALEAATTGRLSIVYYDEMGGKQLIDAILHWQQHCRWQRSIKIGQSEEEKRRITCESTPSPREMALAAFGVQRSEWLEAEPKLIRAAIKRILPCITQGGVLIPQDIITAAVRRASMPQTMSEFVWYNEVLCVTCAMIRYNYEEKYKEEGRTMEQFFEDNPNDRDVLYGRLLAVYDFMEQRAMREDTRTTNAKRYWNAFSRRPGITIKTIKESLMPYQKKLTDYEHRKFLEWEQEIMTQLGRLDNHALSEQYLPAYYLQLELMKDILFKKNNKGEESDGTVYEQD